MNRSTLTNLLGCLAALAFGASAALVLPPDQPFKEAAKDALVVQPNVAHVSV